MRQLQKGGTLTLSGSVAVACGAATFGREPLRNEPKPCCTGLSDVSTFSAGFGRALALARLLVELTCNHFSIIFF